MHKIIRSASVLILFFLLLQDGQVFGQKKKRYEASDFSTVSPAPYDHGDRPYKGLSISSYYVMMRDSVQLAVDVYLPKNLEEGAKIPTILHQTRYWRRPEIRWPFSMFTKGFFGTSGKFVEGLVENGYALVNVDARGSGASFGSRKYPWSPDEVKDGAEIIDWILQQEWSNGIVGSMGASYSSTTAEFLATNQHPNLKAVVLLYSLYDVYDDISFPGGVHHKWFTDNWGKSNEELDNDHLPIKGFMPHLMVKGVKRVDCEDRKQTFKDAVCEHCDNLNVDETSRGIIYRDDVNPEVGVGPDSFSPFSHLDEFVGSEVAVYCYSGWLDGPYQHAAIRRYLNIRDKMDAKLTIGPWEHGGSFNCSPANQGASGFDHLGEVLKFFDHHLKGVDNGIDREPEVHWFTMGEEAWKSGDNWPPPHDPTPLFLQDKGELSTSAAASEPFTLTATNEFGTGTDTRWRALFGKLHTPYAYADWMEKANDIPFFETSPLEEGIEITGHPVIELFVSANVEDFAMHVYLQDVDEMGNVVYLTEGLLRARHHKLSEAEPLYKDVVPFRTYRKDEASLLKAGEIYAMKFDLIPISWKFKKGHKIRLSLSTADKDHFAIISPPETEVTIHSTGVHPSSLILPVIRKGDL